MKLQQGKGGGGEGATRQLTNIFGGATVAFTHMFETLIAK